MLRLVYEETLSGLGLALLRAGTGLALLRAGLGVRAGLRLRREWFSFCIGLGLLR
jgi:hypothetical protein